MKYRFALCSDTHGKAPPFFLQTEVDAVLHAGDVYHAPDRRKPDADHHALQLWMRYINLPVFAVRGNHDFVDCAGFFSCLNDLTGHVARVGPNILIAGLGLAYPKCSDLPTNSDLLEASARILIEARRLKLLKLKPYPDRLLLLSHYPAPARSLPDPHQGYDAIPTLLAQLEAALDLPALAIIEGHIHERFRTTDTLSLPIRSIPIYRPGPAGAILEIDDETWQLHYHPY
jgi:DNA repair exonuclease SbcCD nuclease subunit